MSADVLTMFERSVDEAERAFSAAARDYRAAVDQYGEDADECLAPQDVLCLAAWGLVEVRGVHSRIARDLAAGAAL